MENTARDGVAAEFEGPALGNLDLRNGSAAHKGLNAQRTLTVVNSFARSKGAIGPFSVSLSSSSSSSSCSRWQADINKVWQFGAMRRD